MMDEQVAVDPLDKLFIPHDASIREIAAFLLDYCRIDLDSNKVRFFKDRWILIECQVLLYLMCLRVMVYKQQRDIISASPAEIARSIDAVPGSVRPKIKQLFEMRLITREDYEGDGRKSLYSIPTGKIYEAMKYIKETVRLYSDN